MANSESKMDDKLEYLGKQIVEVMDKYEEFRQCPKNEVGIKKRVYMDALDVLGYMFKIYKKGTGETEPTKEEQDFLGLLEDKVALENVIKGHYNTKHGLLHGFVDLKRMEEIREASKGELYDFKDVLRELGINLDKE